MVINVSYTHCLTVGTFGHRQKRKDPWKQTLWRFSLCHYVIFLAACCKRPHSNLEVFVDVLQAWWNHAKVIKAVGLFCNHIIHSWQYFSQNITFTKIKITVIWIKIEIVKKQNPINTNVEYAMGFPFIKCRKMPSSINSEISVTKLCTN